MHAAVRVTMHDRLYVLEQFSASGGG